MNKLARLQSSNENGAAGVDLAVCLAFCCLITLVAVTGFSDDLAKMYFENTQSLGPAYENIEKPGGGFNEPPEVPASK